MAFNIIKNSGLRTEIERMLAQGVSPRKVSEWTRQQGDYISHVTITAYKNAEFNFVQAAVQESTPVAGESKELFDQGKRSVLQDIEFCNRVISAAETKIPELAQDLSKVHQFKVLVDAGLKAIDMKIRISSEGSSNEVTAVQLNVNQLRIDLARHLRDIEELEEIETQETRTG